MGRLGRAGATGTVAQSLDEAMASARLVAAKQGLQLDEDASAARSLAFHQRVKPWARRRMVTIDFVSIRPTITSISISTELTFAIADRGRGRRIAIGILDGLSAQRPFSLTD